MAPRGSCRWALLLAWLPAGEWGCAGAAESRTPPGAAPRPGTTLWHRAPGPGRLPGVRPGVNVVRCGGRGGGPAAWGRGGLAWPSVVPRLASFPSGWKRAGLSRARCESHAERSFVTPKVRLAALLGGSSRRLPGSLQYRSCAATLVSVLGAGCRYGGAPLWLITSTQPSLCC